MKFGPNGLRFTLPIWTLFRRCLVFLGRNNTIHLQETAVVIEGELRRFSLPILDMFVQRALAERTMVTIPYSRIVRHVHARYLAVKAVWWSVVALLGVLGFWAYLRAAQDRLMGAQEALFLTLAVAAIFLAVVSYLVHRVFQSRQALTFRGADGRRRVVCFWFTTVKRRRQFTEVLHANRDAARTATAPAGKSPRRPQTV